MLSEMLVRSSVTLAMFLMTTAGNADSRDGGMPVDGGTSVSIPPAAAWSSAALWNQQRSPSRSPSSAIGGYAAGCLAGAASLPTTGPGYELLHLGRRRGFGHPVLISYIKRLAANVKKQRLGMLLVGDLGQARGGPTPNGHRSHQTGLDVDLSYAFPPFALKRRLTAAERETIMPPAVVDLRAGKLNEAWQPRIPRLLELAASDPAVDRIFVNPLIKKTLCEQAKPGAAWLRKLRPWWLHQDHFHVRLSCPPGSDQCQAQPPLGTDDGCGASLRWWFSTDARTTSEQRKAEVQKTGPPPLPEACQQVLHSR